MKHAAVSKETATAGCTRRDDFPVFADPGLVYLDSAASAQKPAVVLDAMRAFDATSYANIHRGVYALSERATAAYEGARGKVRGFLHADADREIVFTRGATEAVNLVANSFARPRLGPGDEILITHLEHHANIVPWQMVCAETGAQLRVAPINDRGDLDLDEFAALLGTHTRLVAFAHVSNALGTVNPVREMTALAHARGVPVLVDGAQAVPHLPVDVQDLDCDFYVFSGHKLYGPTGIGALYAKWEHLESMPPWQGGGDMILSVSFDKTIYAEAPRKFEAGTPNITGAVGLGAAIDYLTAIGWPAITAHEEDLEAYAEPQLAAIEGLRLIGTPAVRAGLFSFVMDGIHPHDVGTFLAADNIAVRSGHHCAQPVMERFGVPATTRASLGLYNTRADVDALVSALKRMKEFFAA
ncbi:cysteine desulfurase CsdA [bacterium CG17_big_fil_post_rev_8_21_14_2_50_64_8]|nr:MAG: cysteine desulfurase CsdA [bacterium CG17_big_fil_post_rev_8_21_14_2_50_64_8]PJA73386.1 MAG: cysteine desulfurase CsdA [bacterium CG_4_9_14_3_um_filter_65_15]